MSSPVEVIETAPRASIDTVVGERPQSPKVQDYIVQQTQYAAPAPRNEVERHPVLSPPGETFRPLRLEGLPHEQRVEWDHIRAQLGISDAEEGRIDLECFRTGAGLTNDEESSANLFKQLCQATLVFLTIPFMLLHGVFKMTGAICKSLGVIFSSLAALFGKLTYKPKNWKKHKNRQGAGPIQI